MGWFRATLWWTSWTSPVFWVHVEWVGLRIVLTARFVLTIVIVIVFALTGPTDVKVLLIVLLGVTAPTGR